MVSLPSLVAGSVSLMFQAVREHKKGDSKMANQNISNAFYANQSVVDSAEALIREEELESRIWAEYREKWNDVRLSLPNGEERDALWSALHNAWSNGCARNCKATLLYHLKCKSGSAIDQVRLEAEHMLPFPAQK